MAEFLLRYVLLPVAGIVMACFYFYFAYGYFSILVLHRLTKASFKLNLVSIFDLFISYFFALIVFLVVYYHLQPAILPGSMSPDVAILFGISIIFLGRLITKNLGVFYGKVHFSAIFLTGAILILYRALSSQSTLSFDFFEQFYEYSITGISFFVRFYSDQILISISAALIMSTIGEFMLSMMNPTERKLVSVMEKFPSGFFAYTGLHERNFRDFFQEFKGEHHGLIDKIEQMLKPKTGDEIKTIKCFVKSSLWLVEQMDRLLGNGDSTTKVNDVSILKRPDKLAIFEYVNSTFKRDPSPDIFLEGREKDIKEFIKKYLKRSKILKKYTTKEYDLGRMAFLLVEYTNKKKCLMLIVLDTGPRMNRIGLYTEEGYVIETFDNLFDCAWKISPEYDPTKSDIAVLLN